MAAAWACGPHGVLCLPAFFWRNPSLALFKKFILVEIVLFTEMNSHDRSPCTLQSPLLGFMWALMLAGILGAGLEARGQTTPAALVSFTQPGPGFPATNALVRANDGSFYGMTKLGGSAGYGTVFKVTLAGVLTTLVNFDYNNGAYPLGNLLLAGDGNFYGLTNSGGNQGAGTAFRMTAGGTMTILAHFPATAGSPEGSLIEGGDGHFYGMTPTGGALGSGTVFRLTSAGVLSTVVNFDFTTGAYPDGALVKGADGSLYGLTQAGGAFSGGTAFKVSTGGTFTALVDFESTTTGSNPTGALTLGTDGNFYGSTKYGGSTDNGTVFQMTPAGVVTTLVEFAGANGANPGPRLIQASDGHLYGVTSSGGGSGEGTAFRLTTAGVLTKLYDFSALTFQAAPGGWAQAEDGVLYGMSTYGGSEDQGLVYALDVGAPGLAPEIEVRAPGDVLLADGAVHAFGIVNVGQSSDVVLTINNTGVQNLSAVAATIDGPDASEFSLISLPASLIAPLGSSTVTVRFTPGSSGSKSAFLRIASNDADENPYDIALIGGPEAEIAVEQPLGSAVADGGGRSFPGTVVGNSSELTFTISNSGVAPLTGLGITIDGAQAAEFSVIASPTTPVASSGTTTFTVRFTPASEGVKNAVLHLGSNDADENPYDIQLSGPGWGLNSINTLAHLNAPGPAQSKHGALCRAMDGNLYGMSSSGGSGGSGTVFKVTAGGVITTLVSFDGSNGAAPLGSLIQGSNGDFYGMTSQGGTSGNGTIFKMNAAGDLTTLVHFNGSNGADPSGSLTRGGDGNFYGMTRGGGDGFGTLFRMTPAGVLTTLVSLSNSTGINPHGSLLLGADGDFYGMTKAGGTDNLGTVFRVSPSGQFTKLVNLNFSTGGGPYGDLVQGSDGDFYGLTSQGGNNGDGTAFKITAEGVLTTLADFNVTTGAPKGSLVRAFNGSFYGLGTGGALFRLSATGTLTVLDTFVSGTDGSLPQGSLVQAFNGMLYGMTSSGGSNNAGTLFFVPIGEGQLPAEIEVDRGEIVVADGGASAFGAVAVGSSGSETFAIRNLGGQDLTSVSASIDGADAAEFAITGSPAPTVSSPGGSSSVTVTFTPSGAGPKWAVLHITSNDANESPYDITLVGGPEAEIEVEQPVGTPLVDGRTTRTFPATLAGTSQDMTFTVLNTGAAPLNLLGITLDGVDASAFSVVSLPATAVPVAGSATFTLRFSPGSGGVKTAAMHLSTTDVDESPFDIKLRGTGISPGDAYGFVHFGTGTSPANPAGGQLTPGPDGSLYGLTRAGGSAGSGTAFRSSLDGTLTTLFHFGSTNGATPLGGLVLASDGHFYGTTSQGGDHGYGTVFKMTSTGVLTTLVHFNQTNGATPKDSLIQGRDGDLYGVASAGGVNGHGTLFKVTLAGVLTTLAHFEFYSKGAYPQGRLVQGDDGSFYGMAASGGPDGAGTIFKVTPGGVLTRLAAFGPSTGLLPQGGLVIGSDGSFYGMTSQGGSNSSGNIFKLTPTGVLTTLVECNSTTGTYPNGDLVLASDGHFYGLMSQGGANGKGTVFRLTQAGVFSVLSSFDGGLKGAYPSSNLVQGYDGVLYGMAEFGGANETGTLFSVHIGEPPLAAEIAVAQPPAVQVLDGGSRSFGVVTVGSSADLVFTLRNLGALDLTGITGTIDSADAGDFEIVSAPPATIPGPAGSGSLTVRFTPSSASPKRAVLHISSNDANETPYDITLVGGPEPEISIQTAMGAGIEDGDLFAMGSTVVGTRGDFMFTLLNTGAAPLNGIALTLDGPDAASFSVFSAPASSVTPAGSTSFGLRFLPGSEGARSAFLRVASNDTDEAVFDIQLSAAGIVVGGIDAITHLSPPGPSEPASGSLVLGADGAFYGLTEFGGSSGLGTVFKVTPGGVTTTLASFTFALTGSQPRGSLVLASDGHFYGMTQHGGSLGNGVIFKMTSGGTLTKLFDFSDSSGKHPSGSLIQGNDGLLYGTTSAGGSNDHGTIFKTTLGGTVTVLVNLQGASNGSGPGGSLVQASDGNFYGTTTNGGSNGRGTVFKMTPAGVLTTLVHFDGFTGEYPKGTLVEGADGSLYGMTYSGGSGGFGTLFKVTKAGVRTTLLNFNGSNGKWGGERLLLATDGNFYGLTSGGGSEDRGTVFRLTPAGVHTLLDSFQGSVTGGSPLGGLAEGSEGILYGMAGQGGDNGKGTLFRLFTQMPVTRDPQTITFTNPGTRMHGDAPFALGATASSGLAVTYTVVSGPAEISGGSITLTGAGSVTVRASQAGDASFDPAPDVEQTFTVLPSNNANLASLTLGGGTLSPVFSANVTSYTVTVPNTTASLSFTAVAAGPNATLGGSSSPLSLMVGSNTLTVSVTAANGTSIKTYTVTVTRQTVQQTSFDTSFQDWVITNGLPSNASGLTDDADGDGHSNFKEFAFGTNPVSGSSGSAQASYTGSFASAHLTAPGQPTARFEASGTGVDYRAVFTRRADHAALGVTYTIRFSADLIFWETSTETPTVLDTAGNVELVSVNYPLFVRGKRARFFVVVINHS